MSSQTRQYKTFRVCSAAWAAFGFACMITSFSLTESPVFQFEAETLLADQHEGCQTEAVCLDLTLSALCI